MKRRSVKVVSAVIVMATVATWIGRDMWLRRDWFEIQAQQLAAIKELEAYRPSGWEQRAWNNALVTPYNVWGNVIFSPDYSKIGNVEMRELKQQLDRIVAETNSGNSIESVDRVFSLLLQLGQRIEFITNYRAEFKTYDSQIKNAPSNE